MLVHVVSGVDEGPEEGQEGEEDWTTDDEGMDEAEQISKAKSMAAVLRSSKGTQQILCATSQQLSVSPTVAETFRPSWDA